MFLKFSKFFIYFSLISPLLVTKSFLFPFITGKAIFFRTVVGLALLFFILAWARGEIKTLNLKPYALNPLVIAVSIFTFLFLLSSALGVNPLNSFFSNYERGEGAFQMFHYFVFFFLLLVLFKDKKDWLNLLKFSVVISLLVSFYAIGQFCEAKEFCSTDFFLAASSRISGTLGNSSYLAVYLMFHLFFLAIIFFNEKNKKWKTVWASVALFQSVILLNTQTRGVILGLIIALLIWLISALGLFVFKKTDFKTLKIPIIIFLCSLLIFGGFYFASKIKPDSSAKRFINALDVSYVKSALKDRIWVWQAALAGIMEHPMLGWGAENFPVVSDKYYNPKLYGVESWFDRAHSIYFDYAISGGILLLLAYLSIFFFFYRRLFGFLKQNRGSGDSPGFLYFSLFFILATAYLIQGLILFDVLPIYLVLFLFLAFFINLGQFKNNLPREVSSGSNKEITPGNTRLSMVWAAVFFLIVAASFYFTAYLPMQRSILIIKGFNSGRQFDFYLSRYTALRQKEDLDNVSMSLDEGIKNFSLAVNHSSIIGEQESLTMFHQFINNVFDALKENEQFLSSGDLRTLMDFANRTFENKKENLVGVRAFLSIGIINIKAGLIGQEEYYFNQAQKHFEEAMERAPTRPELIYPFLDLEILRGDKEKSLGLLKKAQLLRPDLIDLNHDYLDKYQNKFPL